MNSRTMDKEDIVAVVTVDGEEYMQYREVPIDTLVIRGTCADEAGEYRVRKKRQMVLEVLPAVSLCAIKRLEER